MRLCAFLILILLVGASGVGVQLVYAWAMRAGSDDAAIGSGFLIFLHLLAACAMTAVYLVSTDEPNRK